MGRFLYQNRKSRPEQPGFCIFQDMKNPGGHGFFKRGISLAEASDLGRRPKTPQPSRRLAKRSLFRVLRDAASLRGWSAPKALPLESAAFEKAGEAFGVGCGENSVTCGLQSGRI